MTQKHLSSTHRAKLVTKELLDLLDPVEQEYVAGALLRLLYLPGCQTLLRLAPALIKHKGPHL